MKGLHTTFFWLLSLSVHAQMLDPLQTVLQKELVFNEAWVATNKIREITISHSLKPSSRPIRPVGRVQILEFDTTGKLQERTLVTSVGRLGSDTSISYFSYDRAGRLQTVVTHQGSYQKKEEFAYFPDGTLYSYSWASRTKADVGFHYVQGEQYKYDTLDSHIVVTLFNDEERPFATRHLKTVNGKIVSSRIHYRTGSSRLEWKRTVMHTDSLVISTGDAEFRFGYLGGNVLGTEEFVGKKKIARSEWLYLPSCLPKARLRKTLATEDIGIERFEVVLW